MKTAFELLSKDATETRVEILIDGSPISLRDGENLAAELLRAGITTLRKTPVSGAPRGPFCMMGACYDCLVLLDGERKQACQQLVTDGLKIEFIGFGGTVVQLQSSTDNTSGSVVPES